MAEADAVLKSLARLSEDERKYVLSQAVQGDSAAEDAAAAASGVVFGLGWTELVVLSLGGAVLFYVMVVILMEVRRYSSIPASKDKTIKIYLQYRFGAWYSKTPGAATIVLVFLSMALLVIGGVSNSILTDDTIAGSLWAAWIWIVAPDGGGSAEGYYGRIAGLLVSCGGMLIFAMLMSIVSAKFEEMLDMFKHSGLPIVEGGHTVILGWSPMVPFLVGELCDAKEGSGGCVIVLLTPLPKVDVEEKLEDSGVDFRNSQIVVRCGDRRKSEDLEVVALSSAAIAIVVSRNDESRENADAIQLNVLSAMRTKQWPTNGTVLVQCMLQNNRNLFMQYCHSEQKEAVVTGDLLGALMVRSTQQRGLAEATLQILGFDGAEFYVQEVEGIAGRTFREIIFGLPNAVAIGIARGEELELVPDMDTKLRGNERIIMLAEDETTCPTRVDMKRLGSASALGVDKVAGIEPLRQHAHSGHIAETVLIIGWNEFVGALLVELDKVLAPNSTVVIFSPVSNSEREAFIKAALKRRNKTKYANFKVKHRCGPLCARAQLAALPLQTAQRVLILADSTSKQPRDKDSSTVAVALQVLAMVKAFQEESNGMSTVVDKVIVPQILLSSTVEHFQSMELPDYILSDRLVASICAQVACNPKWRGVIEELFSEHGVGLRIRKLEEYPELVGTQSQPTFANIAARAALAGEVAIGVKLTMSAFDDWELNPSDWFAPLEWQAESRIVCFSRSEDHKDEAPPTAKPSGLSKLAWCQ